MVCVNFKTNRPENGGLIGRSSVGRIRRWGGWGDVQTSFHCVTVASSPILNYLQNFQCKQNERDDILSKMPFLTGPRSLNPSPQPFPPIPLEKPAPGQSQCLHPSRPPMTENLFCPHIWITERSRTFPKCWKVAFSPLLCILISHFLKKKKSHLQIEF